MDDEPLSLTAPRHRRRLTATIATPTSEEHLRAIRKALLRLAAISSGAPDVTILGPTAAGDAVLGTRSELARLVTRPAAEPATIELPDAGAAVTGHIARRIRTIGVEETDLGLDAVLTGIGVPERLRADIAGGIQSGDLVVVLDVPRRRARAAERILGSLPVTHGNVTRLLGLAGGTTKLPRVLVAGAFDATPAPAAIEAEDMGGLLVTAEECAVDLRPASIDQPPASQAIGAAGAAPVHASSTTSTASVGAASEEIETADVDSSPAPESIGASDLAGGSTKLP